MFFSVKKRYIIDLKIRNPLYTCVYICTNSGIRAFFSYILFLQYLNIFLYTLCVCVYVYNHTYKFELESQYVCI